MQKLDPYERATIIIENVIGPFTKTETHDQARLIVGLLGLAGLIRSEEEHAKFEDRVASFLAPKDSAIDFADRKKQHG